MIRFHQKVRTIIFLLGFLAPLMTSADSTKEYGLLVLPEESPQSLLKDIRQAKQSIDVALYHLDDVSFIQALKEAQQRGVKVRVLLNKPALWPTPFSTAVNQSTAQALIQMGVQVGYLPNFQYSLLHSKYMVIDQKDAWVLTFNWDTFNFKARNFGIKTHQPEQVEILKKIFENDFAGQGSVNDEAVEAFQEKGIILGPKGQKKQLIEFLKSAEASIVIYQQDLSDPDVGEVLQKKAKEGVQVQILMSPKPFGEKSIDMNRINHTYIIKAGGDVRFFPKNTLYVHAKIALLDADIEGRGRAYVGSCNFWPEALQRNRELGIIIDTTSIIERLKTTFDKDFQGAVDYEKAA